MKDQYFGDINDYRKYGLLRVLFLLAAQDRHAGRFGAAIPSLRQRWRGQIEPLGLADLPTGPMTRCAR